MNFSKKTRKRKYKIKKIKIFKRERHNKFYFKSIIRLGYKLNLEDIETIKQE